ncbi:MAG: LegC family aminotransferase [Phycisphaerales bacterium JB063]
MASPPATLTQQITDTVAGVIRQESRPVPLHIPTFGGNCNAYVKECIDTGWVSSVGSYVTRFEEDIKSFTGANHAIATVNGTAALHIALLMAGVETGDHVLCPSLTFVATANAISYCGATPHFVDVEARTLGIDPAAIQRYLEAHAERRDDGSCYDKQTGARIKALVGMHAFGHPFDLAGAQKLCDTWGITFVEDAAESLGSLSGGRHTGTFAKVGMLSFNGNKIITTGGGGMVLTDDDELGHWAKHITTTAKQNHRWAYVHDEVAYNYRLPNLNAALGCAQLEQIDDLLDAKRGLAQRYIDAFEGSEAGSILPEPEGTRSNYWFSSLVLEPGIASQRDDILNALCDAGFLVRPIWQPMHTLPMYQGCPRMPLPVTEDMARRVINLPSSAGL